MWAPYAKKLQNPDKEIKDNKKSEETYCVFIDRRLSIVKTSILPKMIDRFNAVSVKTSVRFIVDIDELIVKFIWKSKIRITKTIEKETKLEDSYYLILRYIVNLK